MLRLAVAALILAPVPAAAEIVVPYRNYPQGAANQGQEGVVYVAWEADEAGAPLRCWTKRSSGNRGLDAAACRTVMALPGTAARDAEDRAIASYRADHVVFRLPGSRARLATGTVPDASFTLRSLPEGAAAPVVAIRQVVAADGRQESCTVTRPSGIGALDRVACTQAGAAAKERPLVGRDGRPARWLADWQIAFDAAK